MKYVLPLLLFIGLSVFLAIGLKLNPREIPSPLIDKPAPAFNLPVLAEPSKTLTPNDLKGKVWLLNVWASWCISCREEHPLLVELAKQNRVTLIGLNYKDEAQAAELWLGKHGNPYNASVMDSDGRIGIDYGVYGVPETFVIDKRGVVRHKHTGPIQPADLEQVLLPMIERLEGEPS
ncbi:MULTISPECIES: DsbE family thiol:disulfide interchange protein [Methylomonas]|uniref:Thiol:disulfide interchange protein n=1 Tax=Methylomonas koyamae TaxID=702114 RepID=A0A177N0Z4_9GAMM|nr:MULTISPECIES: DsbE family thiol:disulfide interchange protein [Methylomonas]OAI11637.1 thiol:disulfide interchange protein [Methylomonas koyamae]WGS88301.1 DsbE family thiol:disulfide interchange protein [Methylomonas sp. UP202]